MHFTADDICLWAKQKLYTVSRATIYNVLNELAEAGLLRPFQTANSTSVVYDSNLQNHFHLYDSNSQEFCDLDPSAVQIDPNLYKKYDIEKIEIVIKARPKSTAP